MKSLRKLLIFFKDTFNESSYFKKVLFSLMLTSCIMFIIFSSIFTIVLDNNYTDNLIELNEKSITQNNNIAQNILGDIYTFGFTKLNENADVLSLLYGYNYDLYDTFTTRKLMNELKAFNSLIHSVYIVNFNLGQVITDSNNRSTIDTFYDQELISLIKDSLPSRTPLMFIPRTANYLHISQPKKVKMLSLIYHNSSNGALVINIDQEKFVSMVNADNSSTITTSMIINKNGNIITHTNTNLFGLNYLENDIYKTVLNQSKNTGTFAYSINNERYYVTYSKQNTFGFVYITLMKHLYFNTSNNLLVKSISYSIGYLLIAFIASLLISFLLYKPIDKLKISLKPYTKNHKTSRNEFTNLALVYENIIDENTLLKKNEYKHKKEMSSHLLRKLLNPNFVIPTMGSKDFNHLTFGFENPHYLVSILSLDNVENFYIKNDDIGLIKYSISNVIAELTAPSYHLETIDISTSRIVLILNFDDFDEACFTEYILQLQDFMQAHFKVTLSCGIGTIVNELEDIATSYDQADTALCSRLITGHNSINVYNNLSFTDAKAQLYPYELENNILSAIKSTKSATLDSSIDTFFNVLKTYYFDQILQYTLQLNASIQRLSYTLNISSINRVKVDEFFFNTHTLEEISDIFKTYCHSIIQTLCEAKSHDANKSSLISTVATLVDENLYNENLSVVFLADQVHLSVNYLRNIFKEHTGESLFNYILRKRLDLICHLLTDTDSSLQDISDQLGFSTKNYFFTFFKKNIGMTPSQYRLTHKEIKVSHAD